MRHEHQQAQVAERAQTVWLAHFAAQAQVRERISPLAHAMSFYPELSILRDWAPGSPLESRTRSAP